MTFLLALLAGGCIIVGGALCLTPRPRPLDPMLARRRSQATHLHAIVEAYATGQPLDAALDAIPDIEQEKVAGDLAVLAEITRNTIAEQNAQQAKRQQGDHPTPDWLQ
jgi:hypothetical protein